MILQYKYDLTNFSSRYKPIEQFETFFKIKPIARHEHVGSVTKYSCTENIYHLEKYNTIIKLNLYPENIQISANILEGMIISSISNVKMRSSIEKKLNNIWKEWIDS